MSDPVYKTVEVTGTSRVDVTQAVQTAVDKASESLRNIDWFELVAVRGSVQEGKGHADSGDSQDRLPARMNPYAAPASYV